MTCGHETLSTVKLVVQAHSVISTVSVRTDWGPLRLLKEVPAMLKARILSFSVEW